MQRIFLMSILSVALLAACHQKQQTGMGPAQQAGKIIDDAGVNVETKVKDQLQKADQAAQRARAKIEDATEDASRNVDQVTEKVGKKVEQAGEKIQQAAHE